MKYCSCPVDVLFGSRAYCMRAQYIYMLNVCPSIFHILLPWIVLFQPHGFICMPDGFLVPDAWIPEACPWMFCSCTIDTMFVPQGFHVPFPQSMLCSCPLDPMYWPHGSRIPISWMSCSCPMRPISLLPGPRTPLTWTPSTCSITAMFPCQACHTPVRGCPAPVPWMQSSCPTDQVYLLQQDGNKS